MTNKEKTMLEFAGFCFIHKPELASDINTLIANFINKPNEALILPVVSVSLGYDEGYKKGWTDATSEATVEINKNYQPNEC